MNNIVLDEIKQLRKNVEEDPNTEIVKRSVSINWQNGTENHAIVRGFSPFIIDEPAYWGGRDKAANPIEYFLMGIASCFATNFEIMASQEGIRLEKVTIDIETKFNLAVQLGIKKGERGIQNIVIKLHAVTSAPAEKVKEVASRALMISPIVNSLNTDVELCWYEKIQFI